MAGESFESSGRHIPVMREEVLRFLAPKVGGRYLDGTLGLGGHSRAILESVGGHAELLGLDRDAEALEVAREQLSSFGSAAHIRQSSYSRFPVYLEELGWEGLDGALLDLGISSLQLDDPARGFSFMSDGPLDMRMDPGSGLAPAANLVNKASVERLKTIISEYGEEPMAGRIARAIAEARESAPIETTRALAEIVVRAYPAKWRRTARTHPATKTFQALRMAVNMELDELETFLGSITDFLRPGGRLVVIAFHSLEDRLVKNSFRPEAKGCLCPHQQVVCTCDHAPRLTILTKKPLQPSESEVAANPRSRSAKLRAAERLPDLQENHP